MRSEDRYLWFAPHAGLWPSFRMEHRLADALARSARSVTMVHCRGVLDSYCPVMSADRLTVTSPTKAKRRSCTDCRHNAGITEDSAHYDVIWLDDFVSPDAVAHVDSVMAGVTADNWSSLTVGTIPVGRYAAYLAMLHHKLPDVTSSPEAWAEYRSDLRNALLVAEAMPGLLDAVRPSHAVVYNPLYPTTRVFAELATIEGAQLVGIHAGSYIPARYETVGIFQHISASQTLVDSPTVRESLELACTPAEVHAVERHLRELMSGNDPWVYSAAAARQDPVELRSSLGLRPSGPVVVALLSSPDETRSSMLVDAEYHRDPERGYSDIAEFIASIRHFAEGNADMDVVLRLHPRLAANKRESVASPDLAAILSELDQLPPNAHVNAPGDGVSLYDLIGISSAAINQSSSSGLEFLALGLPVVSFDPVRQNAYPPEFGICVDRDDEQGLADAVRTAVASGAELQRSVMAFRWLATIQLRALLHLADLVVDPPASSGSLADTAPPPADPAPPSRGAPGMPAVVRRAVPVAVRERGARWLARRSRLATVPDPDGERAWAAEWRDRVDAVAGTDVIWRPPVIVRGTPDPDVEPVEVRAAVRRLVAALGFGPGRGFGPVGEF